MGELLEEGEAVLSRGTAVLGGSEDIDRASLSKGEFEIPGEFSQGGAVRLAVLNGDEEQKGTVQFILEPTEIHIKYEGPVAGMTAKGGHYQERVVSSWRN